MTGVQTCALPIYEASQLPPICKVVSTGNADLHEARAIGIQVAAGEYIVMAEDHCFPDAGWTEAVLQRLEQGWDAIGSAMRPGNREDCWSEASFLVGYGEWMIPLSGGPTNVLCGWNGTVRTALLRQFGDSLGSDRKSTRLNSSHIPLSRMPSSA